MKEHGMLPNHMWKLVGRWMMTILVTYGDPTFAHRYVKDELWDEWRFDRRDMGLYVSGGFILNGRRKQ